MTKETGAECRVCGHAEGNRVHQARETMYGVAGVFSYLECAACGCLQLTTVPHDLASYYPSDYCSYGRAEVRSIPGWRRRLKRLRTLMLSGRFGPVGWALIRLTPLPPYGNWMQKMPIGPEARILDIGCGAGHLLLRLQRDGFTSLVGIDPYIAESLVYPGGLAVKKQRIEDLHGEFDLIMLHHSFEHMDHPREVLSRLVGHLAEGGRLLIRIPLAGTYAWRKYGVSWASLDAPRHIFLHTPRSLSFLAAAEGLEIDAVIYDSHYKQIALSELISLGVNMMEFDQRSKRYFTPGDLRGFKRMARELNAQRDGDSAAFILVRSK